MFKIGLKLWSVNAGAYLREAESLFAEGALDYVELFVVPGSVPSIAIWQDLRQRRGIPFVVHNAHSAAGCNIACADDAKRNREIYAETKRFADALDAKYVIFHGGVDGTIEETVRQLESFAENRALLENKPRLALPNTSGARICRGATEDEIAFVMRETGCGFCLDVGHAVCAANAFGENPYSYIKRLMRLKPSMFHLSGIEDMSSPYDAHPHLGTGSLDINRLVHDVFPPDAMISIETVKDSAANLDDFRRDVKFIRRMERNNG